MREHSLCQSAGVDNCAQNSTSAEVSMGVSQGVGRGEGQQLGKDTSQCPLRKATGRRGPEAQKGEGLSPERYLTDSGAILTRA